MRAQVFDWIIRISASLKIFQKQCVQVNLQSPRIALNGRERVCYKFPSGNTQEKKKTKRRQTSTGLYILLFLEFE